MYAGLVGQTEENTLCILNLTATLTQTSGQLGGKFKLSKKNLKVYFDPGCEHILVTGYQFVWVVCVHFTDFSQQFLGIVVKIDNFNFYVKKGVRGS